MTAQSPRPGIPARSAIGLDIGGTKIAGGVVTDDGTVLDLIETPTPATGDAAETLEVLRKVIDSLRDRHPAVEAIGAGAAGMVEWPSGHIRWAPNNAYRELPLRQLLTQETGLPAVVDNDANVAAWAEARHGAAVGYGHVVVLTVGTGIGAGVVLGGQLQRGHSGLGGEIGHIILTPDGSPCGCGNTGCLEAMASGTALGRAGREAAAADPDGVPGGTGGRTRKGHRPSGLRCSPAGRPDRTRTIQPDRLLARRRHRLGGQSPGYRASRHRRRTDQRRRPAAKSRKRHLPPIPVRPHTAAAPRDRPRTLRPRRRRSRRRNPRPRPRRPASSAMGAAERRRTVRDNVWEPNPARGLIRLAQRAVPNLPRHFCPPSPVRPHRR